MGMTRKRADARRIMIVLPLLLFVALAGVLAASLLQPRVIRHDPMVGRALPAFSLPLLDNAAQSLTPARMKGQVTIINFFASWCAPCRAEQAELSALAQKTGIAVYGISYKDDPAATRKFLTEEPDPYTAVGVDASGMAAMDFGVTGVPETFVIDRAGVIRYRLSGPLTARETGDVLLPLLSSLEAAP